MRKSLSFFVVCMLLFGFLSVKAEQQNFKKIDFRSLDKVLDEKGQKISDPEIRLRYGNIIREMAISGQTKKNVEYRETESLHRNSIDNILIVNSGYTGQIYLDKNDYKYKDIKRNVVSAEEYSIFFAFIGFLLFLIYYLLDNYLVKADKETHQIFLILLGIGTVLIAAALVFAFINHLLIASILGLISIFISIETWKKDSWLLFFLNISVVLGFIISLYYLK